MKASKLSYGIAAAFGAAFALFVVFVVLRPSDRDQTTPYADFERDLAAGKIDEVVIDGTTYRYRVRHDAATRRKTTGPNATLASIIAMRPSSKDMRAPKVMCEP
jgi:hypothetical protein